MPNRSLPLSLALRHLVLGFCMLLLGACGASHQPAGFAQEFYQTIASGKTDEAIALFSIGDIKAAEMTAARGKFMMVIGQMQAQIKANGGLASVEAGQVTQASDDEAQVAVTLQYKNGKTKAENLHLVREDGKWKVKLR